MVTSVTVNVWLDEIMINVVLLSWGSKSGINVSISMFHDVVAKLSFRLLLLNLIVQKEVWPWLLKSMLHLERRS